MLQRNPKTPQARRRSHARPGLRASSILLVALILLLLIVAAIEAPDLLSAGMA